MIKPKSLLINVLITFLEWFMCSGLKVGVNWKVLIWNYQSSPNKELSEHFHTQFMSLLKC